ncbi:RteC protein [anaerobic digester metagenome]
MEKIFNSILQRVNSDIQQVETQESDLLVANKQIVDILQQALSKLKEIVIGYQFETPDLEICFFKELKPRLMSKLIFHNTVYRIELNFPNGSREVERKYITRELRKLTNYFDKNLLFYQYYRTNSTYMDEKYFLRGKPDIRILPDNFTFETDPQFSTMYDFKVAKILANELLRIYLVNRLHSLDKEEKRRKLQHDGGFSSLQWTGTKRALVELIYAIGSHGDFNRGKAGIKEIATYFEAAFNVDLGDYYHIYMEMKERKVNRTRYLDTLQKALLKRMSEQDG